jgi:leucyl-tRNA synthetase
MDTFMCSSWYFLRYCSPLYARSAFDPDKVKQWMPVDIYTGGAEHAVMHLFYARFFVKALRDMGLVDFDEPFLRLFNQGTITHDRAKMSKSRGNVINPDDYVNTLGADTVRAYLMFIGPWEQGGDWDDSGISGLSRFLARVWALTLEPYAPGSADETMARHLKRVTHQAVRRVTDDMEKLRFNTMLAALMEYSNYLSRVKDAGAVSMGDWQEALKTLLLLLAPTAPHMTEELWSRLGLTYSIHAQPWPKWDAALAKDEEVPLLVQVNGKLRDKLMVAPGLTEELARQTALGSPKVQSHLAGKTIAQCIYVPGRLINLVVK